VTYTSSFQSNCWSWRRALFGILLATFSPALSVRAQTVEGADALPALQELSSVNGVLSVTLEAAEQKIHLGQAEIDGAVYNGNYAGPVLRVHPGDVLNIKLVNHLARTTNLHFHGIDTSPLGMSDNIHRVADPGETLDYTVVIPKAQPPGTYWYHDHIHRISEKNVMDGLSGAMIVDGFVQQFPELAHVKEQLLVLKDYEYEDSNDPYVVKTLHKFIQSINGSVYSKMAMQPGETQLWHIVNQSADYYFDIALKNHKFRIIGEDGVSALRETEINKIKIKPASRMDVLVDAGAAGDYDLVSEGVVTGAGPDKTQDRILGKLVVEGEPIAGVGSIENFPPREDLRSRKIDATRSVVFSQLNDDAHYYINGLMFDPERVDTRVPLGNVEEWTLRNDSDEMHVFHIHQVSFQVTEINGEPQPFNSYVDLVRIPERGSVKIRMAFTDPVIVGKFMYHCHVLKHEDHGMMAMIEVYDPAKENMLSRFWQRVSADLRFAGHLCGARTQNVWSKVRLWFS
jgi:FtsP/CotA-like multicopper oxidase with cupredoxin domain